MTVSKQDENNKSSQATFDNAANLTPQQIVEELNKYIVGQEDAKKAVAIALRNRYRRKKVSSPLREEIAPKNILCIGPTGVGKTEIARRLAKLANAPFIKVEATKFTEVGYVGRDVESIIRDLTEVAIKMTKTQTKKQFIEKAKKIVQKKIIDYLVGENALDETREKFTKMFEDGQLNDREIEIDVIDSGPAVSSGFDIPGGHVGMINLSEMISKAIGGDKTRKLRTTVKEAAQILLDEESDKMIDQEKLTKEAVKSVENDGIVFIDEIDKICSSGSIKGADVSRDGVQRDLLPLVEGTTVTTKYGLIKTDHILFIAAGAFHLAKPSDLLPELQGRFPIRVQLKSLTESDLVRILKEPESSLVKQYEALIAVENINLTFNDEGIKEIARLANKANSEVENIGARRLYTLMEKILENVSYNASEMEKDSKIVVNKKYVNDNLGDLGLGKADLSKFIL